LRYIILNIGVRIAVQPQHILLVQATHVTCFGLTDHLQALNT